MGVARKIYHGEKAALPRRAGRSSAFADWSFAEKALRVFYVFVPFVMGLDKFTGELLSWSLYLPNGLSAASGITPSFLLYGIGCWEMAMAMMISLWPRMGAGLFAFWLITVITGGLIHGEHFELASVAIALAAGAIALAQISRNWEPELRLVR